MSQEQRQPGAWSPRDDELLRSVVERLAIVPRLPTSEGERRAAFMIRDDLLRFGCQADVEEVPAYSSYAWPIGLMCAASVAAGWAAGRGHRLLGAASAGLSAVGIADDISGGRMAFRRLFLRPRRAYNVIALTGDVAATRTLVVLAHHDAASSGFVFRQQAQQWLATHRPDLVEAMASNPPLWWIVIAGPALVSLGSATGHGGLRRLGLILSTGSLAAMVDIGSRPAVPGANDNLTGVGALIALARALQREPVRGLRVMLLSAGAEEALQEGIRGFARRYFPDLPHSSTFFLNLDTVGSGRLVLLEGEGPVRMRDYDPAFKDLVAGCAMAEGIPLLRGLRSRYSTDGAVPLSRGYPAATIVSVDHRKLIPNYHLDTDVPAHVDFRSAAMAIRLAEAVARSLANQ
jgi:peptidase M28-like protein